jgi:hypothetical protein
MFPRLTIIQFVLIRIHPSINCIKFTLIHLKTSMFIVQYFPLILTWHHHLHCVGWHGKYSSYDFKVNNDINYICSKILVCVCVCVIESVVKILLIVISGSWDHEINKMFIFYIFQVFWSVYILYKRFIIKILCKCIFFLKLISLPPLSFVVKTEILVGFLFLHRHFIAALPFLVLFIPMNSLLNYLSWGCGKDA